MIILISMIIGFVSVGGCAICCFMVETNTPNASELLSDDEENGGDDRRRGVSSSLIDNDYVLDKLIEVVLIGDENILVFKKSDVKEDENMCPICLDEYNVGEYGTITECGHCFHSHCLCEWFMRSNSCPICNKLLIVSVNPNNKSSEELDDEVFH